MSETPAGGWVAICPHCRKTYAVRREHAGRSTTCKACKGTFVIAISEPGTVAVAAPSPTAAAAAVSASAAAAPAAGTAEDADGLLCPVCQASVGAGDQPKACPECLTAHHADCWEYNRGCGLYGCKQAPETEKLRDVEIPASFWGQTEKHCPNCQAVIQAAAVRCRHCGMSFNNARPQEASEFRAQLDQQEALTTHKRMGIALFVAAIVPCTAPLAAVVGIIWYLAARRSIAKLPPLYATICLLAIWIAVVVTLAMITIAWFHSRSA